MARQGSPDPHGFAGDPRQGTRGAGAVLDSAPAARRVLVIDDSPEMLDVVSCLLRRGGYLVEQAGGGPEGLRRLREAPPDLVVTDLHMPEASGWDVARAAGRLHRVVPVILMTGDEEAVRSNAEGRALVDAVLLKPFGVKELLEQVRRLIGNGAAAAPPTARDAVRPAGSAATLSGASAC